MQTLSPSVRCRTSSFYGLLLRQVHQSGPGRPGAEQRQLPDNRQQFARPQRILAQHGGHAVSQSHIRLVAAFEIVVLGGPGVKVEALTVKVEATPLLLVMVTV